MDRGNYRGVFLLPLISRIVARIFASRIREWAEELKVLGENQNGFRTGRSTCDATQIILRIDEETRRVLGNSNDETEDRPGAVLLDITKAYPRVNRPLLWSILENLGMTKKVTEVLKGLHERTRYRVKGREGLSDEWLPAHGLREGCATSPILFNIYHAESMRKSAEEREKQAKDANKSCGLDWGWKTGSSFPANKATRIKRSSACEKFTITDSLFADDSTLIGWSEELKEGKETIKKEMMKLEEKCHDGKEEIIWFASETAENTRMLGTLIGKKKDREARIRRANGAWAKVKKWLWKSKLSKRTRALVVQAVVESSLFFDCNARPWTVGDLNKFQSVLNRFYRYIWNNGKGLPLVRMQEEGVNGYEVRRQLGITSIRSKVEIRALERIGHVLCMPNERMTKKVVLGRWLEEKTENGKLTGGLIAYWKRLIGEAGEDWTNIENLTKNRKTWKTLINNRKANLTRWETDMCDHTRGHTKPTRSQARVLEDGFSCRWTGCDKICRSKAGLVQHER